MNARSITKAHILSVGTAVPAHKNRQASLPPQLARRLGLDAELASKLKKIFLNSCIEERYSVLEDFVSEEGKQLFNDDLCAKVPGTLHRNEVYKQEAPKLATAAAQQALERWGEDPGLITHVISVSCTGMMTPGIECHLIDQLGLSRDVDRLGINFMGCFGAFRGLSAAAALALENPEHRVLVVCTELCTLHFQSEHRLETFVANALFADGAGAAVVGAHVRPGETACWSVLRRTSTILPNTSNEMTWDPGDHGYVMRLTEEVPKQIRRGISDFVRRLVADSRPFSEYAWAVHPGGKAILHGITQSCGLSREHLTASWEVLRRFGNMSSATMLFILDHLKRATKETVALSFGPGLAVEGLLLSGAS